MKKTSFTVGILLFVIPILIQMLFISYTNAYITSGYGVLPDGTYDIAYDTYPDSALWSFFIGGLSDQHARVRFTPKDSNQLIRQVRIKWNGAGGNVNNFYIYLVDADTGMIKTTYFSYIYTAPRGWEKYDVSDLEFYTDGDFYVEIVPGGACSLLLEADDTSPETNRSQIACGAFGCPQNCTYIDHEDLSWHYHDPAANVRIRVVLEGEEKTSVEIYSATYKGTFSGEDYGTWE